MKPDPTHDTHSAWDDPEPPSGLDLIETFKRIKSVSSTKWMIVTLAGKAKPVALQGLISSVDANGVLYAKQRNSSGSYRIYAPGYWQEVRFIQAAQEEIEDEYDIFLFPLDN